MLKLRVNELYFFLRVLLFFEEKYISEKEKKSLKIQMNLIQWSNKLTIFSEKF